MTRRGIIYQKEPQECELCGKLAECRPYGPHGEQICYECGRKDVKGTEKRMSDYIFGKGSTQ